VGRQWATRIGLAHGINPLRLQGLARQVDR